MTAEKTKADPAADVRPFGNGVPGRVDREPGGGMPTLCSNYVDLSRTIINQSENGVIGYGPLAAEGEEDRHLVNAGGQHVTALAGMGIVHHADSFGIIRGGMIDVTVMGAYEVAENGDFANWRIPNRKGGGIGGAMDLAACAQRVFIAMEHTTREGSRGC